MAHEKCKTPRGLRFQHTKNPWFRLRGDPGAHLDKARRLSKFAAPQKSPCCQARWWSPQTHRLGRAYHACTLRRPLPTRQDFFWGFSRESCQKVDVVWFGKNCRAFGEVVNWETTTYIWKLQLRLLGASRRAGNHIWAEFGTKSKVSRAIVGHVEALCQKWFGQRQPFWTPIWAKLGILGPFKAPGSYSHASWGKGGGS